MPTPGYVFKDGGIIPDDELATKNTTVGQHDDPVRATFKGPSSVSTSSPMSTPTSSNSTLNKESHSTESHALANADHDVKGAAQVGGQTDHEVRDLGWNDHPQNVPKPLVGGLPNEELWLLVRRFNKVRQKVTFEGKLGANCSVANVPCQSHERSSTWRT
jgi:hypothetical protein